ncbi:MAG TPA: hypothetical protein VK886_19070 [Vicinamibacterales bacterium]|nr:hypothetical protein [Vicinamibacterales bacterium]
MSPHRLIRIVVTILGLAGALPSVPAGAQTATSIEIAPRTSPVAVEPLNISDANAIVRKWGIRIESLRLTASGYMLDFRYTVIDARKAKPLFKRQDKPVLRDEETGRELLVPVPPKTGALRNSNDPQAGRTYFMFFGNPARFLTPGRTVTITIGAFAVSGVRVEAEPGGAGATQ